MKISSCLGLLALLLLLGFQAQAQSSASCQLNIGGTTGMVPVTASVPATSLSGLDFNLSITLPGLGSACPGNYDVTITSTGNLLYSTGTVPFTPCSTPPTYCNAVPISNQNGENLLVAFKFKPGVTCNGEKGEFNITVKTVCNGQTISCTLKVSLTAVAQNYWSVKKEHLWGNLKGGYMMWKITLTNGGNCVGAYNIASGTIVDQISCSKIVDVTKNNTSVPFTLNTAGDIATWATGTIPCSTPMVEYIVTTVCCDPNATAATNCARYGFSLGKSGPLGRPCERISGKVCDTVALAPDPTCVANFWKALTYPQGGNSPINYTTGCEGEYTICFSNTGNTPLTNFVLTDIFPAGITVQQICVNPSVANMNYTVAFAGGVSSNTSTTGNTGAGQCWPFSTAPTGMTLTTTSGSLTYGTVCVRVRFLITAIPGTLIKNCATLAYTGTNTGVGSWCNIVLPACTANSPLTSCAEFKVEDPRSVPGLRKSISGPQQSYFVGQTIPFCITVSNHGAAPMTNFNLADALGGAQNLEIQAGSVTYQYGIGPYGGYTPWCPGVGTPSATPPSTGGVVVVPNLTNLQNPSWTISLPGECSFDKAYYLVIKFDALVKPQLCEQKINTAVLTGGTTTLSSPANYNVLCIGKIGTTKLVNSGPGTAFASTGYVNPSGAFQYLMRIENMGSVNLTNLYLKDAFPSCVKYTCSGTITGTIYNANGTASSTVQISCTTTTPTTFTVNPATTVLAPGQYIDFIVNVTRTATGAEPCCNEAPTGYATVVGTNQNIQDNGDPACVRKSICCDLEEVKIEAFSIFPSWGNWWNFGLNIYAGNLPIQEVEVSLMDFHFNYNFLDCKPQSVGNFTGHLGTSTFTIGGGLNLVPPNPITNNDLLWKAGTPVMFTGGQTINLRILRPAILNIPCCKGKLYYCLKVRLKDVKCRVCEKIVCLEVPLGASIFPVETQEKMDVFQQADPSQGGN